MWRCLSSNLLWGGALEIFFDFNFPANSDQQNNHQWLHYILRAPKLNQAAIGLLMRLSESWRCTSQADSILNVWHGAPITWPPISIMLRLLKRWTKDRFIKPPLFNCGGWPPRCAVKAICLPTPPWLINQDQPTSHELAIPVMNPVMDFQHIHDW